MRRLDYSALFAKLAAQGIDSRIHWATGLRAGSCEPWDGDPQSAPGERSRFFGKACHEGEDGCCYLETLMGRPRLLILGAGHVGAAVASIAGTLGFTITVVDERPELADPARLSGADEVVCGPYDEVLTQMPPYANSYVVIVTPGHRLDQECAAVALRRPFEYLGMIGSRGKVAAVRSRLSDLGFSAEELDRLHAPIGLPLGGREPAEIAVSICAQLIQVRSQRGARAFDPAIQDQIVALVDEPQRRAVLATIIGHGGSTPRGTGSRMLVGTEGLLAGSVGGGAVEAAVIARAQAMAADPDGPVTDLVDHDLSDREGAELGMICGGRVRVMLELL